MANTATHQLPPGDCVDKGFDPSPLPHRPVQWRRAADAMRRLHQGYDNGAALDYASALEGDDGERYFQAFLAEPGAADLLRERPRLDARLDDFEALAELPDRSLGRVYLALAQRDAIRVADLIEAAQAQPDAHERAPDEVRRWFYARMVASHDLLHVITGYERDSPGELLLLAFTQAIVPKTVFRVSLALGSLGVPLRYKLPFALDTVRAYRRGRAARIPRSLPWDDLLGLQIDEVRARLRVASTAQTHHGRCWREEDGTNAWLHLAAEDSVARA